MAPILCRQAAPHLRLAAASLRATARVVRGSRVPAARLASPAVARQAPAVAAGCQRVVLRAFCSSSPPPAPDQGGSAGSPKSSEAAPASSQDAKNAAPEKPPSEEARAGSEKAEKPAAKETEASGQKGEQKGAEGAKAETSGDKSKAAKDSAKGDAGEPLPVNWSVAAAGAAFAGFLAYSAATAESAQEITVQELMRDYLPKDVIERVQIVNRSFCRVHLKPEEGAQRGKELTIQLGTPDIFEMKLEQAQAELGLAGIDHLPVQHTSEVNYQAILIGYGPTLIILASLALGMRGMMNGNPMGGLPGKGGMGGMPGGGKGGRNMFNMGKAFPEGSKGGKSEVRFKDVAGQEQAKREVVEFVDFLQDPEKYAKLGARIPKGGLLVGPPGTGKTLLAKAVAGEAECPFFAMSGSDFVEMYGGVGASRMRDLFKTAREQAPSIIFIDEIDAIGRKRSSRAGGGNDERETTLNQMLVEMDGFNPRSGVVVLAGTNRSDILDQALLRPGRFDRQIAVGKPDLDERAQIFQVHLKPVKLHEKLPADQVAKRMATLTPGMAGADIANVCNEAAIVAARRASEAVEMEDFERATERVLAGLPKSANMMSLEQRRAVSLHECGHAVAGWFLQHADPLLKVSIVPRSSGALGFAQYLPQEMSLHSREAILDRISVSLAGRAAEELFVGAISTGAQDDLDKVTKMAYAMIKIYGMNSELGLLSYNQEGESFTRPYSEETSRMMDRQAREIVDQEYKRVKQLLLDKEDILKNLSARLLEKETLVYNELREIMGERPVKLQEHLADFLPQGQNPFTAPVGAGADGDSAEAAPAQPPHPEAAPVLGMKKQ